MTTYYNDNTNPPAPPPGATLPGTGALRLREAALRDGPAIVSVIREAFGPVAKRFHLTPANFMLHPSNYDAQRYAADRQLGRTFHVAEVDGEIVGVVALRVLDHRTGEIARLAVKPAYQKRGLGAALMVYALAWGRSQDLARMELTILAPFNELREWYEGFGFTSMVTRELPGVPLAVTWMGRTLRPVTVRSAIDRTVGELCGSCGT